MAAVLACGNEALLSHVSAATLWDIRRSDSGPLHVTLPGESRHNRKGIVVHRTRHIDLRDRATVRGIPTTSIPLTLIDLAETLPHAQLARAVHEAEVLRLLDTRAFHHHNGRRGAARLQALLKDPEPSTTEEFDAHFLALCQHHGLPRPRMHVHFPIDDRLLEIDALWPAARVCAELDGARFHHTRRAFHRDRERDLALAAEGYVVIRLTWDRVTNDAAGAARDLKRLLTLRGSETRAAEPAAARYR
ncbi:MAG: hypothetical protein QOK31_1163 [Solirubrobacteraceae bacterium]|nr:hypothetical protein [Solirubrobacteraceae bacterium]